MYTRVFFLFVFICCGVGELQARDYTLVPEPQKISLGGTEFEFGSTWHIKAGPGVQASDSAMQSLTERLQERFQLVLSGTKSGPELELVLRPGSVTPGPSQDNHREAIASQTYKLTLSPTHISIAANEDAGLFYGVQTLIQLVNAKDGKLHLPEGEILDWPDLRFRSIYWDDAHHLERLSDLEAAVRQASFFKINAFGIKLEGHFQYESAPALVEPQALSPAEFQQLTDYGLRYHVEVIPYLDAPAHVAFILKHPEYAKLREFPASNYEFCETNPDTLKLLFGMYDDLLAANKGVHYFYLSTDEAYYVGMADHAACHEKQRAQELGSRGKVLAEFLTKAAGHLYDAGREVIFWGEYPLKPDDIEALPTFLINGETGGDKVDPLYKAHGIRQMIYGSTEGEEKLFPQYALLPESRRAVSLHEDTARIADGIAKAASDPARLTSELIGMTIAGWADMGLHPETFWLGYAVITATAWHPWTVNAEAASNAFYPLFYGPKAVNVDRVYQLMSYQAQIWTNTWDNVESTLRKPIWGNSEKIFDPPQAAHDQKIGLPPIPDKSLAYLGSWTKANAVRLTGMAEARAESDELLALLAKNVAVVTSNRYNLEVFQSIAGLCRQNLDLIAGLERIDQMLEEAGAAASAQHPKQAVAAVDRALAEAKAIRMRRNEALRAATATWYKSWLPRVAEANGRKFVHEMDDVKDHLPDRTVDMSYLIYRDLQLPFDDWYDQTEEARNQYAHANALASNHTHLSWTQYH